jgi:hypothetical protein
MTGTNQLASKNNQIALEPSALRLKLSAFRSKQEISTQNQARFS